MHNNVIKGAKPLKN